MPPSTTNLNSGSFVSSISFNLSWAFWPTIVTCLACLFVPVLALSSIVILLWKVFPPLSIVVNADPSCIFNALVLGLYINPPSTCNVELAVVPTSALAKSKCLFSFVLSFDGINFVADPIVSPWAIIAAVVVSVLTTAVSDVPLYNTNCFWVSSKAIFDSINCSLSCGVPLANGPVALNTTPVVFALAPIVLKSAVAGESAAPLTILYRLPATAELACVLEDSNPLFTINIAEVAVFTTVSRVFANIISPDSTAVVCWLIDVPPESTFKAPAICTLPSNLAQPSSPPPVFWNTALPGTVKVPELEDIVGEAGILSVISLPSVPDPVIVIWLSVPVAVSI